jgi:hypothetical protein
VSDVYGTVSRSRALVSRFHVPTSKDIVASPGAPGSVHLTVAVPATASKLITWHVPALTLHAPCSYACGAAHVAV